MSNPEAVHIPDFYHLKQKIISKFVMFKLKIASKKKLKRVLPKKFTSKSLSNQRV